MGIEEVSWGSNDLILRGELPEPRACLQAEGTEEHRAWGQGVRGPVGGRDTDQKPASRLEAQHCWWGTMRGPAGWKPSCTSATMFIKQGKTPIQVTGLSSKLNERMKVKT